MRPGRLLEGFRDEGERWYPEGLEASCVEQTARRAGASFGEPVDHRVAAAKALQHRRLGGTRQDGLDLEMKGLDSDAITQHAREHARIAREVGAGRILGLVAEKADLSESTRRLDTR